MRTVFADTVYWIALINPRDSLRTKAEEISNLYSPLKIVTSEMVLTEVLNSFSKGGASIRRTTLTVVKKLYSESTISIVPQTSSQFEEALSLYAQREDKAWSLTDCASFQIMWKEGIAEVLTHDRHFEQAGFKALLRD